MENVITINKRGVGKTLKQWAELGFVPKRGRKGELRYANRGDLARGKEPQLYYDPADVKEDKEAADFILVKIQQSQKTFNIRGFTLDKLIERGQRPKKGCEGHLRKKYPGEKYYESHDEWYWDPEDIEKGDLFATRFGRKLYKLHQNRTYNRSGKTLNQWLQEGYIPKKGQKGHERYRSELAAYYRNGNSMAIYFDEDEVRSDPTAAKKLKKKISDEKKAAREERKRKEAEEQRLWQERDKKANAFREEMKTRYQWAQLGRIPNADAKFKWGESLNERIKDYSARWFGRHYLYCHFDETREATADEMAVWNEFFEFEKQGDFLDIRRRLIDLCPEYQQDRDYLIDIWQREANSDCWWDI